MIERYGLLNIIVLGEVLLSISFMFGELYDGHFDWALVSAAVAGIVIVFCIWWLYFIEPDHLNSTQAHRVFLWGYGHIAIFLAGTLIAAGLGAHMDVLTDHSKIDLASANAYVGAAVAIYVLVYGPYGIILAALAAWRCPANFGPDTDRGGLCWCATLDHRDYPDDHPWFAD